MQPTVQSEQDKMVPIDTSGDPVEIEVKEDDKKENDVQVEQEDQPEVSVQEEKKDEELEEYSQSVKRRIDKLTRKMREAERQKEEAIKYAEQIKTQAEQMKGKYDTLGNSYTKELEAKVNTGMDAAKLAYRSAVESQDVDGQVEAQKAIAQMAM